MGNYHFAKDFKEAQVVEKEAAVKVEAHFPSVTNITPYDGKEYDFACDIDGVTKTFEVKNELMVTKTGNVAIEYTSRGKDSGIQVTTADYWVEKIRNEFYLLPVAALKEHIQNREYDDDKCGGDRGSKTCFYLVKEQKFLSWCVKL